MSEDIPKPPVQDKDFVVPPTAESLRAENEQLRNALENHDYATFSLWLQKGELEYKRQPIEHAQLLARAATILNAVGNADGAVKLLLRAASLVKGKDAGTEEQILSLVQAFGGDGAVAEYSKSLRAEADANVRVDLDDVQAQYSEISEELVALDRHDWKEATGKLYTEEERQNRLKELRAELQKLVIQRGELRKRLELESPIKK